MKPKTSKMQPTAAKPDRPEPKVYTELTIVLCNVVMFDCLSPIEYQSLFTRTQAELEDIKKAYTELISSQQFNKQTVLQFALDPAGLTKIKSEMWESYILEDCIALTERGPGARLYLVYDRPTYRLFQLFFDDPKISFWKQRIPKTLKDDDILTPKMIEEKFGIPRSTLQSWEVKGIPSAQLPKLIFEEDRYNHHSYRFGYLDPFIEYYYSRKAKTSS